MTRIDRFRLLEVIVTHVFGIRLARHTLLALEPPSSIIFSLTIVITTSPDLSFSKWITGHDETPYGSIMNDGSAGQFQSQR
jgi:hypothetical protein